ncbi:polyprenyl synthetase family protein [Marinitenerispora sediminis]|uniref:Polyprenyl synthetase n=1 Tax=Marinitenerispora sediminis TaxID=1931232 RepID=A0A368SZG2_9ACTN|nr:polyprenyl synthetase family protein [Marinitenerispora sediminis]RCV48042.1 polyprenyl synthetase [Marinitenerispora sediminis]RCV49096.1 polyprenyl synthetase [Marinitenerispora sediminis]RCV51053.1 polyprenyl synthetase [Marinitenerispora sediminis]
MEDSAAIRWRPDWPERGAAPDLDAHDRPHPGSGVERWWFGADLVGADGPSGLVCSFLRNRAPTATGDAAEAHAVLWFRSGARDRARDGESWFDAPFLEQLRCAAAADPAVDPRVRRAYTEALGDGRAPLPDRLLPAPARVGGGGLDLDFGGVGRLRRDADGGYLVEADGEHSGFALRFAPLLPAVPQPAVDLHGRAGRGAAYAYCVPRLAVTGTYRHGERTSAVDGEGWYEHTFGDAWHPATAGPPASDLVGTWARLRLDNGWHVLAVRLGGTDVASLTTEEHASFALVCAADGERTEAAASLRGCDPWTSLHTLNSYGTGCDIEVPRLRLKLRLRAWFPRQETPSLLFGGGMLQAHVSVTGTLDGRAVGGTGVLEVLTAHRVADFERHITRVRDVTLDEIARLYPARPERPALEARAGLEERPHELEELVVADLHAALVEPVRHALAGLGKSWRSYVATAAIELFGVDSEPYRPLLGAVEVLHTGNLVIDDVEDRSPLRRGRPAVHVEFGEATAINAGTAAYFVFDDVLHRVLPDDERLRLRVYRAYLQVLRAGHAGQALDIAGHRAAMDAAVRTGDAESVLRRVRAVHRLKTAAPVRGIAEIGALIAGAEQAQLRALRDYAEAVGLAYQINDDVMDLRGVTAPDGTGAARPTKHTAEDLRAGKVTMPLAHAVALLPGRAVRDMWHAVRDGAADQQTVTEIARALEKHGVVDACLAEARGMVERAWRPLQAVLPLSHHSVLLRALGGYAARRERE